MKGRVEDGKIETRECSVAKSTRSSFFQGGDALIVTRRSQTGKGKTGQGGEIKGKKVVTRKCESTVRNFPFFGRGKKLPGASDLPGLVKRKKTSLGGGAESQAIFKNYNNFMFKGG